MTEWHSQNALGKRQTVINHNPARILVASPTLRIILFLLLHIPLALMMDRSSAVSTLHALITFLVAFWWAISPQRPPHQIAGAGIYIISSEVLWRMTGARVPWEFGKYAIAFIFLVYLLRENRLRIPKRPLLYFVLLLPSAILTLSATSLWAAREIISFNLSGPFSLMISAWFFSNLTFTKKQLQNFLLSGLPPVLATSTIILAGIIAAPTIHFGRSANFTLSGGYGPNQVSSVLALGALIAFWCVFHKGSSRLLNVIAFALTLLFVGQSVLTFSRGGLYNVGGSALIAAYFLARDSRTRLKLALITLILVTSVYYVLWPQLDNFTGGALTYRFTDVTRTSGRELVVLADLEIWRDNPLFGVGPEPRGPLFRSTLISADKAAHTEQTRLLAEHGIFGFVALLLLFIMTAQQIKQAPTPQDKAFVASMIGFSLLYMLHAAMRLAIPGFVFGLAFATYMPEANLQSTPATN